MSLMLMGEPRRDAEPTGRVGQVLPSGERPPAIILGGGANALSIARSLGRYGVPVYAVNSPAELVRHSRFARWIPLAADCPQAQAWTDYLLGAQSDHLAGAVLLAASDAGLQIIARHRAQLAQRFLLDDSNPEAQLRMLNKLDTYRAAAAAGVPTPRFWVASSQGQIDEVRSELVYPLIVKPQLSHVFEERFGRKYLEVDSFDQLRNAWRAVSDAGVEVVLMEKIPGPDDRLCSYYTYLDENGEPLFHFTKRIIRRFPVHEGLACYHITDYNPEVRELGLRLFQHVGLRGLANVEFKRDDRDGRLKLIECNARFTAANCLVARSGFDLARFVYNRIVGLPQPRLKSYRSGVRLWYPVEDFKAFLALRRRGELSWPRWIASILHCQTLPIFEWTDPMPSLVEQIRRTGRKLFTPRKRR